MNKLRFLLLLSMVTLFSVAYAQSNKFNVPTSSCIGQLCIIDIWLDNPAPKGEYKIPIPSGANTMRWGVSGPGAPMLVNNLGSSATLKLRLNLLEIELRTNEKVSDIFEVRLYTDQEFIPFPGISFQKYYVILLNVRLSHKAVGL
ncbi:MAG: hypothetical protein HXN93_08015 [Prevotella pleuritidis]|nr:hypothetical protein [Hoylesella pleuritidis]